MAKDEFPQPPAGLRFTELEIAGEKLRVFSYPVEPPDLEETPLTPAEASVAELAIAGLSNADIARKRGTSVRTVANQMRAILEKLELDSRRELAVRYVRGELDPASREPKP